MAASSGRGIMFETEADTLSQTLEKDWATAESALIDKRVYPHLLRHTIATRLVNQGMPIASVQQFLGHEDLKTIQLYAKTETRTMQRDFERAMEAS